MPPLLILRSENLPRLETGQRALSQLEACWNAFHPLVPAGHGKKARPGRVSLKEDNHALQWRARAESAGKVLELDRGTICHEV